MRQTLSLAWLSVWLAACASTGGLPTLTLVPTLPPPVISTSPAPTATVVPTAPPAPTEILSPSATPPPTVLNPLTGLPLADASVLTRRPLAIKVAHFPRSVREFQVGLSLADNVWEHYAEGGVVRFTAIIFGQTPEKVGNVRSARLIDAILGDAYQAILVTSGSSTGTMNRLRSNAELYAHLVAEATGYTDCPVLCREESAAVTTNKLFTSPPELWKLAQAKNFGPPQDLTGFVFSAETPSGGTPIHTVHLDFQRNSTVAEWRYDAASGQYARWVDTANLPELAPHVDTLNGQQLSVANVVVLYATYTPSNIEELEGGELHFSYDILLTGEGPATIFRDGQMLQGTWKRAEAPHSLPTFVDASGNVIPLKPGHTWFEVLSSTSPTSIDEANGVFQARCKVPPAGP